MSEWRTYRIGDIATVYDGPHATPTKMDRGPWFLSISSLDRGRLKLSESAHISESDFERWTRRVQPQVEDLLFSYETRLGEAALMPEDLRACLGRRMGLLRPNIAFVHPRFDVYCYLGPDFQSEISTRMVHGATVDRIPLVDLPGWPIRLPNLAEQRAIAAVLGALDDKIAVNERIAATAGSLADAHFEEAVAGVDLGPETFASVATVAGGGTPSTKVPEYWDGDVPWATPSDVTALAAPYLFSTGRAITLQGLDNCASARYPAWSVFMTSRATIGAFAMPQFSTAVNQGFIVVLPPTEDLRWWLFHEMRSRVEYMKGLANGSTFLELSRKNFKAIPIRLPDDAVVREFARRAGPLHMRAMQASDENRRLAALRDTLLPQLMSGRLRVRDAERVVEDAV